MSGAAYILCALTALACSLLLFRGWRRTGVRLLFWSSLCFAGLAMENALLFVDVVVFPTEIDLSLWRRMPTLLGLCLLLFGLIWETR
jgi:hypothetical protein